MKSIYYKILTIILSGLVYTGCSDFVDIKTQGQLIPGKISNYRYLLNNTSGFEVGPRLPDFASDDISIVDGSTQQLDLISGEYNAYWYKSYTWQSVIFPKGNYQTDSDWNTMYGTIAICNTIINEVPGCEDGTQAEKSALIAEALVHRADAYLMLVNSYAKPYNVSTASSDLGLPLILTQTTEQSLNRQSVEKVYKQIIADLEKAVRSLPNVQVSNTLPSKPAAYGELARCYLYMNNYAKAAAYADSALITRNALNDMGAMTSLSTYPSRKSDPEILLSKIVTGGTTAYAPTPLRLSDDLLTLLGTSDKRYTLFTAEPAKIVTKYVAAGGRFFYKDIALNEARNIGPSVPEMMLIKAEYYARNNDPVNAMLWVNKIRVKRFAVADYVAMTASNANDALAKVINERHREFFCRMLRWWDMRRLKDDPMFQKTYSRTFGGTTYTLTPSSNRYVLPIAEYLTEMNPELEQNP